MCTGVFVLSAKIQRPIAVLIGAGYPISGVTMEAGADCREGMGGGGDDKSYASLQQLVHHMANCNNLQIHIYDTVLPYLSV